MTVEPIKFLIVDDIEDNILALEALLRREGLLILKATSGIEALELLLTHEVALAFLDVQMPGMDGFELAELMRGAERTKHVPIIFVTAGNRDPLRVFKGYENGAVDFLYKPVDPRILKSKADVFFEVQRQRRECVEALRLNELFVGILSHDLRNPLGALLTGAQVLEADLKDERARRTLARMTSAGRRMSDMIEQLLDLTRARLLDGVGLGGVRRRADIVALAQRTVDELAAAHAERTIVLTAPGDCVTLGDPDRLLQLFSNVIGNALDHGEAGTPVTVEVRSGVDDVMLRVHNAGAIPPELVSKLFEPFRERPRARSRGQGLGLGLYISQQIALAHGGRIEVESSVEGGTTLTLTIPRRAVGEARATDARRTTVLVVDDDRDTRESLTEAFEQQGYRAISAADGREALAWLRDAEQRPDIVVLDMVMPTLDGNRVFETMRADPELCRIPVVVATADPARAPKGVVVVRKPVKLDRLLRTVAKLAAQGGADLPAQAPSGLTDEATPNC